jgi:FecR-like protein
MSGRTRLRIAAFLICASASAFGQTVGILTVAEGGVLLVRGSTTYAAVQGVALQNGDMLTTDPKGQAQIEFGDGGILNLSRGTRALLLSPQSAGGEPGVALLPGWAKFTRVKAAKGKPFRYITPVARLDSAGATGVLRIGQDSTEAFIESGAARLVELSKAGSPAGGRDVKGGEFVVRAASQPLTASPRPSAEFIKAMPGYFRDDLPVFLPRVRERNVEPTREHEAAYEEVEPWLKASTSIRRPLLERFHSRAKDPQFRSKLIENLSAHPEWDRILFPEKYEEEETKKAGKVPGH